MSYPQGLFKHKQIRSSCSEQEIDSADKSLYKTVQSFVQGAFHKSTANLYYSYKTLINLLEYTSYHSLIPDHFWNNIRTY